MGDSTLPGFQSCACGWTTVVQTNQSPVRNSLVYVKRDQWGYTDGSANHLLSIFGVGAKSVWWHQFWWSLADSDITNQPPHGWCPHLLFPLSTNSLFHYVFTHSFTHHIVHTDSIFHTWSQTSRLTGLYIFFPEGISLHSNPLLIRTNWSIRDMNPRFIHQSLQMVTG